MYNEEQRTGVSFRNIVIQFLFVLLFIFLMMWIFPTKSFINETVAPFENKIFNENLMIMKEAAKDYFTLERLPQEEGDKVKLTLGEMLDLKLLVPFVDANNNKCDENESYVEVTKYEDEYVMKVYLSCSDNEDYILVHMGCYDYCSTFICESEQPDDTRPSITVPPAPVVPEPPVTPEPPVEEKEYICEYLKVTDGYYTDWSEWGEWSTTEGFENDLTDVESETKKVETLIGYNVITYKDPAKPIYKEYQVQTGMKTEEICVETKVEYEFTGEYKYSEWSLTQSGYKYFGTLSDTNTTKYQLVDTGIDFDCTGCGDGIYNIYNVYGREAYEIVEENTVCATWETKETPLYTVKTVIVDYEETTRKDPIYKTIDVTYYRLRTRELVSGTEDRVWSNCDDQGLLNGGYNIIQKVEK